ncbi:hypothetical protein NIES2100_52710 [Calothrix sp. NIES-2100]|uniref:hypothetical protein n=1 Tax=Calothrix sp. NIES-2100 TaxID=1954172 RepID=UPI000B606625|nr:hypothetical protein NIES2100_52710 [Calothrix sp. NIES-2100]
MDNWQFLIQRQGDRAWHTLESPKGEILEGRYRVLARSNRPNIDVEVRVIHSSTQEVPPKRRIQKRSRRTNSEGLMAVIPYTYFKPGIWELQCSGDLMSDILGKSWQYNVYLRVLPFEVDEQVIISGNGNSEASDSAADISTISDNDLLFKHSVKTIPTQQTSVTDATATIAAQTSSTTKAAVDVLEEDVMSDQPVSPVWVKGETAEQILQNLIDLALPSAEPLLDEELLADPPIQPALPPLLLNLDQETYVAHWGGTLTINGRVELQEKASLEEEIPYLESLYALELKISLRSPLKLEILKEVKQPLPNEVLPFTIESSIDIPADCESKLILAEVSLSGALTAIDEVKLLASQSFTITADVSELLAIATAVTTTTPDFVESVEVEAPERAVGIDLSLLKLVKAVPSDQSLTLENKFLPPEIKPRSPKKSLDSHRALDLPNMPPLPPIKPVETAILTESLTAEPKTGELATQEQSLEKVETLAAINMDQLVIKNRRASIISSTFRYLKPLTVTNSDGEAVSDFHSPENSQALHKTLAGDKTNELLIGNQEYGDESVVEVALSRRSKLIDAYIAEVTSPSRPELIDESVTPKTTSPSPEFIDQPVAPTTAPPSQKLIIEGNPYSSPLITKWLENQGFSLPEPMEVSQPDDNTDVVEPETVDNQQAGVSLNAETTPVELNLPLNLDADIEIPEDWLAIAHQEEEDSTPSLPEAPPPPLPPHYPKIPLPNLTQEIVVEDTYIEPEVDVAQTIPEEEPEPDVPMVLEPSPLLRMSAPIVEPLPTPKLYVPEGELIAGTTVRVRVELPRLSSEVVVKLWIEDCQSRSLMDGPHLLKNLQLNSLGRLELTTQLHVPFGCLEMRVEAIALNPETQQESHKVTVMRTVIPPDLPTLQLEELLGI